MRTADKAQGEQLRCAQGYMPKPQTRNPFGLQKKLQVSNCESQCSPQYSSVCLTFNGLGTCVVADVKIKGPTLQVKGHRVHGCIHMDLGSRDSRCLGVCSGT